MKEVPKSREEILKLTREDILAAAGGNTNTWFEINRWVYSRLQLDERREKPRKKDLLSRQRNLCGICGKKIDEIKNTDIHRLDESRWYEEGNAVLVHRHCHENLKRGKV